MIRGIALTLTVLTGFTALVYEVAWQKYLTILLGSDSEATAAVLGIFLGGLSYGYRVFGGIARRLAESAGEGVSPLRLLRTYGFVEAGIGVYALLFPTLFQVARTVSLWMPQGSEALAFGFDVLLTAALIGPPAVLMGGTIPLLTQALARGLADATRFHALVYAFNTIGACGGALCAGFFLIPWLGLGYSVALMGVLNLAAGSIFVAIGQSGSKRSTQEGSAPLASAEEHDPGGFVVLAAAALLTGFAMMTLQAVANRIGALTLGASHFTFSSVVATFVLCIAIGSFAVSAFSRIPRAVLPITVWLIVAYLLILDSHIPNATYWGHILRTSYETEASSFYAFHLGVLLASFAILAIPVALSGAILPLIFHRLRDRVGDLGMVAGRIYSWNTVGSLFGALLGGYALFFWLDLDDIYRLAVLAIALAATILTVEALPRGPRLGWGGFVVTAVLIAVFPDWSAGRLSVGLFRTRERLPIAKDGPDRFFEQYPLSHDRFIVFHDDDPSMTVAVREGRTPAGRELSITNNGKNDGAIPTDNVTMGLAALIPALLGEQAKRAFVIGWGTGWTVGELISLESIEEVVVAEISKAVVDAAPLFDAVNKHAGTSPKTRIIRSDAYRALSRDDSLYDLVVSEPSNPWTAGVELLYTREFLETVRDRLTPGGIHAQWMHTYEMDRETLGIVLRTYRDVFEGVSVWYARGPDLILLGFKNPGRVPDLDGLAERFERPDFRAQFAAHKIFSLPALLSHEYLPMGVLDAAELDYEVHTVLHPILSDRAARAFYYGGLAPLPFPPTEATARAGGKTSLLRQYRASRGRPPNDDERFAVIAEICRYRMEICAAHIAEWQHEDPDSERLVKLIDQVTGSSDHRHLMEPKMRQMLATFLGDGDASTLELSPEVIETFVDYYSYSAPFDIRVLEQMRSRCQSDPGCAADSAAL